MGWREVVVIPALADMGQQSHAEDLADGPQALAGAQLGGDRDPVPVGLDAHSLQADPAGTRPPAGGD